ncbi:UPF0606 protein KIAA1549 isoform X2 [Engraulis encrasicolus]|uniref:UPF0606 protein KIAA1549 isoform X2 n=1 Tax=Engraulis encrasicolus TaxID=184585 RepID=UPI002FD1142A
MEGLILGTSSVGMSKCTLPHSGCCALILGIMILVPMATADTHSVEDWPALASVSPNQPPLAAPNHSPPPSPAALPASTIKASSQPGVPTPALATPRLPSPPPLSPAAADETHSNKPIPPADASSPSPSARPKSMVVEQALEGSAPARRARDLHQPSVPVSQIVPTPTLLHSSQMWSPSPSSPSFGSAVTSDAHVNIHVMPPGLPPVENQAAPNTTTTTSTPTSSVLADAQDPEVVPASMTTAKLPVEISNAVVHDHQLSPSFTLNVQNDGPAEEHLRSVALGERTGVMTPSVEPTMEPVEDFYPTNTMEGYWGSGDYLETMSYMGPEGDDYGGLVTKVPTDMYDFEDPYSEVYDTSFPTRAVLVPSSTLQTGYPSQATRVHSEVHVTRSPFLTRPVQPSFPMTSIPSLTTQGLYDVHVSSSGSPRPTSVLPAFPGASVLHSMPLPSGATHTASIYNWSTSALPTFPPGFAEPYTNASSNVNMTGSPPRIRPSVVVSPLVTPTRSPTRPQDSGPEWSDEVTIAPTDLLLPDMNSLEFFTIQQQGKDPSRPSHTAFSPSLETDIPPTHILPTAVFTVDPNHLLTASFGEDLLPAINTSWPDESSADTSGYEPPSFPTLRPDQTASPNGTSLEPSLMLTPSMEPSMPTSVWGSGGGSGWMTTPSIVTTPEVPHETSLHTSILPPPTTKLSPWDISPTVSESVPNGTSSFPPGISPSATVGPTPDSPSTGFNGTSVPFAPTQPAGNGTAIPSFPTQPAGNGTAIPSFPTQPAGNGNAIPSFPTQPAGNGTAIPSFPTQPAGNDSTISSAPTHPVGNGTTIPQPVGPFTPNATSIPSLTDMADEAATSPGPTTVKPPPTTTVRQYLCNITKPENYLIKAGFPSGSTAGYAKAKVREILKPEFNQSLELQVVKAPPDFVFRVVSGTVVYTAISVVNALRQSPRAPRSFLYVSRVSTAPNPQYHVHTVLQFVPSHMDVRVCSFSERIEKGLTAAYAEVRRRSRESTNFTVQIVNITVSGPPKLTRLQQQAPVDVVFAVRDAQGYLRGADLSAHLRALSTVEFSYYLGLPVLQIAEPVHYPELNMTLLLRSSWVKTVLLGVVEPRVSDRTFQAKMERRLAQLLGEAMGLRRVRRATSVANNSIQMVRTTRLPGADSPLEMVYFVEGANGERLSAVTTATTLNRLDVQRAAIVLGYRVQGILAQRESLSHTLNVYRAFEKVAGFPSEPDSEPISTWVVVGVVVPVLLAVLIASILYWKFCRTDKLEFQPDAMVAGPQRQKLQAPSVKGFDFAKLHLGQPSKDDLRVIQEPGAATGTAGTAVTKDTSTSESGDFQTAKNASSRTARKKGRISPSDGDSVTSDRSSEKGSPLGRLRGTTAPHDPKQSRKMVANGLSGPPPVPGSGGPDDQLSSSASIFEHVDRMSRAAEGVPKRFSNKIQLIAMQPMPALPAHSQGMVERAPGPDSKLNKDVALRHKSEIEHHRNKIRLRAKRKGHYDFPAMDELAADGTGTGGGDAKEQDRIYQKAQQQIDKILDPDTHLPSPFTEPKKSGRGRRSPKSRKMNGGVYEHDRDQLITAETDGTYRKYPGVSNFAYVSDPEQAEPGRGPSPPSPDDVFLSPGSPPPSHVPPPPPYLPPQPSIEEARQQMHSLLDDAFALVSPTAQGSAPSLATAGITLPGVGMGMGMGMGNGHAHPPSSSPPSRGPPRPPWGVPPSSAASTSLASSSPYAPPGPFSGRYGDIGLPPPSAQSILQRQGLGSGFLPPTSEGVSGEQPAVDSFTSRGGYGDELSSSARPRPVGGTPGGHLHHLGMPSRLGVLPPSGGRLGAPQAAGYGWSTYEDEFSKPGNLREPAHRGAGLREPTAPPVHLDTPGLGYPSSTSALQGEGHGLPPPTHSSASLIKAIREELMRLSQKQASLPSFHS